MKRLLPFVFLYFISCAKDNDQHSANLNLLLSGKWHVESIIYNPPYDYLSNGVLVEDAFPFYEPCEKDNYFEFSLPSTISDNEGPTKCTPTSPQVYYGTWKLLNNDNQIEINDSFTTATFTFTGNKLVGSILQPDFDSTNGGKDYMVTATLILK